MHALHFLKPPRPGAALPVPRAILVPILVFAMAPLIAGCFAVIAPDRTAPGAPVAVTAAADTASARVSWSRPLNDGGAVLTGYTASPVEDPLRRCEVPATDSSCVITGLSAESAYTFVVRAHNRKGVGPASDPSAPVIPIMGFPGTPSAITVQPGSNQITVSWLPPEHAGGGTVTGYVAGVSGDTALSCTAGPADTACVVTGLKNDSAYIMEVRARNPVGLGPPNVHGTSVVPSRYATWTWSQVPVSVNSLYGITWTGSLFVVSGGGGALYTSPDGITWTNRSLGITNTLWSVAAGNGILVVVGDDGVIRTSSNGSAWTIRNSGQTPSPSLRKVIWTGTQFVAVGYTFFNSAWVGIILTSPDGIGWTARAEGTHPTWFISALWAPSTAATPGTGLIIAVGGSGTLRTSPDGNAWTTRASGTTRNLNGMAYGAPASAGATGLRVAVGDWGTVIASTDGIEWSSRQVGTASMTSVVWTGTHFMAVASDGALHYSANGLEWRSVASRQFPATTNQAAWNGTRLAVISGNTIFLSQALN